MEAVKVQKKPALRKSVLIPPEMKGRPWAVASGWQNVWQIELFADARVNGHGKSLSVEEINEKGASRVSLRISELGKVQPFRVRLGVLEAVAAYLHHDIFRHTFKSCGERLNRLLVCVGSMSQEVF